MKKSITNPLLGQMKKTAIAVRKHSSLGRNVIFSLALLGMPLQALAVSGADVVAGDVSIVQQAATTSITQLSDQGIINWQNFDISADELVKFLQPNSNSITLNRVVAGDASQIMGQLSANGRVFILNPNGVVFGATAKVDVAGLLASTLNIQDDDFLSGQFDFEQDGDTLGAVTNKGEMTIGEGGFAFLVAPGVNNEGLIVAKLGQVALASGSEFSIDFHGDGLVSYAVSGAIASKVMGADGKNLDALVSNSGTIKADGGTIVMKGESIGDIFSSVVNNDGLVQARSLTRQNGKIILSGGISSGIVANNGTLDVSAQDADSSAGEVSLSGKFVGNAGVIVAQGSGSGHGGTVTLNSTTQTITATGSSIDISGGASGNGGAAYIKSDGRVTFDGEIIARGGSISGDGGFVDVSGLAAVDILGSLDATAANGSLGNLLIDPKNIEINDAGGVAFAANLDAFSDNVGGNTIISAASINALVANVVLQANTDITITTAINIANASTSLTLQAGRSVNINADITTNNGAISVVANDSNATAADRDAGNGDIVMAAGTTISTGSGNIVLTIDDTTAADAGGIQVDSITATGNVTLTSYGAITESVADAATDIKGAIVSLETKSSVPTVSIGQDGDSLEFEATSEINVTTNNTSVSLQRTGTGAVVDLGLGQLDVGTATLVLNVTDGGIVDNRAGAVTNVKAGAVNLTTDGGNDVILSGITVGNDGIRGGSIGSLLNPILTELGILTASTTNGGIFIRELDALLVNTIQARQQGVNAIVGSSNSITTTTFNNVLLVGASDINLQAGGDILIGSMKATRNIDVTSGGNIFDKAEGTTVDNAQDTDDFTAEVVNLSAANAIGTSTDSFELNTESVTAVTTDGGIFLTMNIGSTISSIIAGGVGNNIFVGGIQDTLAIGVLTATDDKVTIESSSGSVSDANGAATNVTAKDLVLTASSSIGSSGDKIETDVNTLDATVSSAGASIHIQEVSGLDQLNIKMAQGEVSIITSLGSTTFDPTNSQFASSGVQALIVENTSGDLALGTVNATNAGSIALKTLGAITDNTSAITADSVTLTAGTNIGALGTHINTDAGTIIASAAVGGIYLREANGAIVSATASGSGNDVDIATATGDLTVANIVAPDQLLLVAGAGSILAQDGSARLNGTTVSLNAGNAIGTNALALSGVIGDLTATAGNGGVYLNDTGSGITVTSVTATGANVALTSSGAMILHAISAAGNDVNITTSGAITDGNAGVTNITANGLTIAGGSIGAATDAIETDITSLTASSVSGGIYIDNINAATFNLLSATAIGSGSDIKIETAGDMALGTVTSSGNLVTIVSGGDISDANGVDINVEANKLVINAAGSVAAGGALGTKVNSLSGSGNLNIANVGATSIDKAALESGSGSITADEITILDFAGDIATLPLNANLNLKATKGDIVFLDLKDTIQASGTGAITLDASGTTNKDGLVITGNLITANQDITIKADQHISIGTLNAGLGNVIIESTYGPLVDNNGLTINIIAKDVSIIATNPTSREALLTTINALADAHAQASEEAAKFTLVEANTAALSILTIAESSASTNENSTKSDFDSKQSTADTLDIVAVSLNVASQVASTALTVYEVIEASAKTAAAVAQAIPMTGDGGAATAAQGANWGLIALTVVDRVASIASDVAGKLSGDASTAAAAAEATYNAAVQLHLYATENTNATSAALGVSQAAYDKAVIATKHAAQVANMSIAAEDANSTAGTAANPLGIQASGNLNLTANNSDIVLALTGNTTLGNISASKSTGDAFLHVESTQDLTLAGNLAAQDYVSLKTTGAIIDGGAHNITAGSLVAQAGSGIGNGGSVNSTVGIFAANAGTGGVALVNTGALSIGTVNGVVGVTAAGAVDVAAQSPLTVTKNVTSTGSSISLSAGSSAAAGDNLTINAVTVAANGAVSLTAGDNVDIQSGASITGTDISVTANEATDGVADGVTGSVVLAGDINGSTATVNGGGLTQTGTITTIGAVDINIISAASSAIQGATLGLINAGGLIDVNSNDLIHVAANLTSTGNTINLRSGTAGSGTDNITVASGIEINANMAALLNAGDAISLAVNAKIMAGTTVDIVAVDDIILGDTVTIDGAGAVGLVGNKNITAGVNNVLKSTGSTFGMTADDAITLGVGTTVDGTNITLRAGTTSDGNDNIGLGESVVVTATGLVNMDAGNGINLAKSAQIIAGTTINMDAVDDIVFADMVTVNGAGAVALVSNKNITTGTDNVLKSTGSTFGMTADDAISLGARTTVDGTDITLRAGTTSDGNDNIGLGESVVVTGTGLVELSAGNTIAFGDSAQLNAGTTIGLDALDNITLANAVSMNGAGSISLTANKNITGLTNVMLTSMSNLGLSAGDDIAVGTGSLLKGTDVTLTADVGAGAMDTTGGITLEGDIEASSSVTITGGGLNHSATITSAGPVNINILSRAASAIRGIALNMLNAAGLVNVNSNHAIALNGNLTTTGGDINVIAGSNTDNDDHLTIGAVNVIGNANVNLKAGDNVIVANGAQITGTGVVIKADNTGDGNADGVTGSIDLAGNVNGTSVNISGGGLKHTGTITSTGQVDITTISDAFSATNGILLSLIEAAGQVVNLSATGNVDAPILDNNGNSLNVRAASLGMKANGGVGTSIDELEIEVDTLAANGGVGGIEISNTGNLILGTVGAVVGLSATGGAIDLSTTGNLQINNAAVQGVGLTVSLLATGGSITEINPGAAADIVAQTLSLTVTGAGNTIGTSAERLEINAEILNALTAGGSIFIEDTAGGLQVGLVSTTGAANSLIDLLVTNGSLIEAAPTDELFPNIIAETLNLAVTGVTSTIGLPTNNLDVNAVLLKSITTEGGGIYLTDTDGGVAVDLINTTGAVGSVVTLVSLNGSILESTPADLDLDINAETVNLQVVADGSNIGTATEPLEIGAAILNVNNTSGQRAFTDFPNGVPTVNEPNTPADLIVLNGEVIGGGDTSVFIQANTPFQGVLSTGGGIAGASGGAGSNSYSSVSGSNAGFGTGFSFNQFGFSNSDNLIDFSNF